MPGDDMGSRAKRGGPPGPVDDSKDAFDPTVAPMRERPEESGAPGAITGVEATVAPVASPALGPSSQAAGRTIEPSLLEMSDAELPFVDAGNYERLEEFARGGLGRIVRARDRRTGRIVALKEMLGDHAELARRFAREARVTANLMHPAIVPVYELGRWPTGEPFYAMKLVAGRSLQDVISQTKEFRERLARLSVIIAVADALAYAHDQRVIHRDLKPANVLVGEFGETVVIDWGLAKVIGAADGRPSMTTIASPITDAPLDGSRGSSAIDRTVDGSVIGTPSYMPPEQARGNPADERADVYAIGAMLYQLITGVAPFSDRKPRDIGELLRLVVLDRPTPVAQLAPDAPPDLVTIIVKAMANDAGDRYPSARELANDLRRFASGQLVQAHRYDWRTLAKRWLRRNKAAVTVAAALVAVLVVGAVYSVRSIIIERDTADSQRAEAERARDHAKQQTDKARASLATALYQKGRFAEGQARWRDAAMYYAAARVQNDTPAARWAAGLAEARSIVPHARHIGHTEAVNAAAISPDGNRVATVDSAGGVRVWKRADGTLLAAAKLADAQWAVAFSPDGRELAVGGDAGVIRRLTVSAQPPHLEPVGELRGHDKRIWSLAYSPVGGVIASAGEDTTVRSWQLAGGASKVMPGHTQRVYSVAFSADGRRLASGSDDRSLYLWDVATGQGTKRGAHERGGIRVVQFAKTGDRVMTSGWDFVIRLWPVAGGDLVGWEDKMSVHGAALTPDERVVVTAGDTEQLRFWETSTKKLITAIDLPGGRTNAVVASADGRWLVTAGNDRVPVVWDIGALARLVDAVGHRDSVNELSITTDGRRFTTASDDKTVRVWDVASGAELWRIPVDVVCAGPQTTAAGITTAGCEDNTIRRWDAGGKELGRLRTDVWLRRGSLSPDDTTVALGHMKGRAGLIEAATGKLVKESTLHAHQIYGMSYARSGRLVSASLDNRVKVWTPDLTLLHEFAVDTEDGATCAAISPDDTIVVAGSQDGSVDAWELATGKRIAHVKAHVGAIWGIAYAADGKHVYSVGDDGFLVVWDTATWRADKLPAMEGNIAALAITPDGATAITGHRNSAIIVWDLAARRPRYRLGGGARDHGSCDDVSQQRWVDDAHRAIVQAACTSEPAAYLARIQALTKQHVANEVDVVVDWARGSP